MPTMRFTTDVTAAKAEIEDHGGRIIHQFSPEVFVAELPEDVSAEELVESSGNAPKNLERGTQMAIDAWRELEADENPSPTPQEGFEWDTPGYESPFQREEVSKSLARLPIGEEVMHAPGVMLSTGTPTSQYLAGSVAIGLVIVSRDNGPEMMTQAEQTKVVLEAQRALTWLATLEPRAKVSFVFDIRPVTVPVPPGPYAGAGDAYEAYEKDWRDAALAEMGYPEGGRSAYRRYAEELRVSKGTRWSYVAFFTKYKLNHFAYAIWEKVVMNYQNDGWTPDNIHRVFAHESCHIFGAADEYGSCACGGAHGHLNVPNNNCARCFPPEQQQDCLMNKNTLMMCDWTRRQIGWDVSLFP